MSVQTEITRLESAKTEIASAIAGKGVTVPDGTRLDGLAALIDSIEAGVAVQRATGTFTTNSSGAATVNCGFQPDVVVVTKGETYTDGSNYAAAIPFSDYVGKTLGISLLSSASNVLLYTFTPTRATTGFSVNVKKLNYSFSQSNATNTQFTYIAYKFT
ncbi:MAG: hypothetical protein ACI3V0_10695 [Faecousia sp.]